MKVKRYVAANMRSALDMIKQEQGSDVLILSNRKVDGGIELVTADELSEQEAQRLSERTARRSSAERQAATPAPATAAARPAAATTAPARAATTTEEYLWTDAGTVSQMRDELKSLKSLLESQLSGLAWSDFGGRHPLRARLMRALSSIGIAAGLARELVAEVPDELDYEAGWHRVLAMLVVRLHVVADPILGAGGRVALLGSTGVGKSTLISKLAARFALAHGPESVAIVSMDDRRLGAHQQMKAFGRLIGSVVYTPRDCTELATLLDGLESRRLVLIDTPGHSADDARYAELVNGLGALRAPPQTYHVLAATTDYLASSRALRRGAEVGLDACILTKLDEAATLGPSLSSIIESGLPLAYCSAGQRVPDDLETVDARELVERGVELARGMPQAADAAAIEQAFGA